MTTPTTSTAYSYDAANELLKAGSTRYSYDDANDLTGLTAGPTTASYGYNGDHARVSSTVNGTTTADVLDVAAALPLVVQQATAGVTTSYLYGVGLLGQDSGAGMQTVLPDALGSTRLIANSSGAVVGTVSYDAYGNPTATGTTSAFGFTGQQTDAESGLLYLRARSYDPATGVFLQRDPYPANPSNPVTLNRYTYAGDNPVNLTDPTGLDATSNAVVESATIASAVVAPVACASGAVKSALTQGVADAIWALGDVIAGKSTTDAFSGSSTYITAAESGCVGETLTFGHAGGTVGGVINQYATNPNSSACAYGRAALEGAISDVFDAVLPGSGIFAGGLLLANDRLDAYERQHDIGQYSDL